jgi:hypothetical protein
MACFMAELQLYVRVQNTAPTEQFWLLMREMEGQSFSRELSGVWYREWLAAVRRPTFRLQQ